MPPQSIPPIYPASADVYITYGEERLKQVLAPLISSCFKQLLETKHLYQAVDIPEEAILAAAKRVKEQNRGEVMSASATLPNYTYTARQILNFKWSPDLIEKQSIEETIAAVSGQTKDKPKHIAFSLPATAHTYCKTCKDRWPFNPIKDLGKVESDQTVGTSQWFYICYQCQSCKGEPVRFLIRRQGTKLRLCGRDPFEEALTPEVLPKSQREHFSSAIIAHQAGQPLAGIFFLRVFIEQYWRRHPEVEKRLQAEPRLTGEQMGETYASTLPVDFKSRFPSLGDIYGRLSESIHTAEAKEGLYEQCSTDIVCHFDALRLFGLSRP